MFFGGGALMGSANDGGFANRIYFNRQSSAAPPNYFVGSYNAILEGPDMYTGAAWSSGAQGIATSSEFIFAGVGGTPFLARLAKNDLAGSPSYPTGAVIPNSAPQVIKTTRRGDWVVVLTDASPFVNVIKSDLSVRVVPAGADIPATTVIFDVAWNTDGTKLVMGMQSSPYLATLDFNGTTLSNLTLATGANIPSGPVACVDVSKLDRVAAFSDISPYVFLYSTSLTGKTSPSGIAIPTVSPASSMAWNDSGRWLAVCGQGLARLQIISDDLSTIINHGSSVSISVDNLTWGQNGSKLAFTQSGSAISALDFNGVAFYHQEQVTFTSAFFSGITFG